MDDIAAWLEEVGLGHYAELFEANDITFPVLPELTDDDLKELGISLGHRRLLLKAIKSLAESPDEIAETKEPSPAVDAMIPARAEAERRQLTVMFVDLVGSTALAGRLDPEDMRAVIGAYQSACSEVIGRYEGHVAKYMGDGVLAYFGYPRAHEDDAERAIRAGLELTEAVSRQTADGTKLAVRIGIATGQVVVGDLIGEGAAQEEAVIGETPNLAARLQALAPPGSVVIGPGTERLVGGLFELADLGGHELRGFDAIVRAWRVVGDSRAESRFAARSASGLTPFVGRQHELGMLLDRFEQARESEGQVVLLSGEPGIGKSRLAHALLERLADTPHTRLRYYCSPYHVNSALHPIIEQLERAAAFELNDPPERKLDKLEEVLSKGTNDATAVAPLLAALLSIPIGSRYPVGLPAQRQRELTIAALLDQLAGLAARLPVVIVLEDGHWLDPTTTELFERVIERVQTLSVLLLITFRPEFAPPWTSYPHMTSLTLNRLGRRHSTEMIAAIAGGKPLPEEVLAQIWTKTEGVPLFVEELTKTVLESGLLEDKGDRYELTGPLPPLAIPATLQDSLMARLDRLAPVKEVAQIGAVIGREFSYRILAALSPLNEAVLQDALSHLVGAELVFRRGTIPDAIYSFKHAFVQDAAYQSLLNRRRQQLHAEVAAALRERFPELADSQPEILAHHLTEADLTEEAIGYWQKAGDRAVERSANTEAIAHFNRGLTLLTALPDSPDRMRREIAMQTALGAPLLAKKGFAAAEVGGAYSRALELCEQADEISLLSPALQGLSGYYIVRAELPLGREMAERCLSLAQHYDDPVLFLGAHHLLGAILGLMGEPHAACDHLHQAVALYAPEAHRAIAFRYGADLGVFDRSLCAHFLWLAGYADQALEAAEVALALANDGSHPFSQALALSFAAMLHQFRRETQAARQTAAAAITLCDQRGFSYYQAWSTLIYGSTLTEDRQAEEGITQMRSGLKAMQATGARVRRPYYLGLLAQGCRKMGKVEEANAHLAEALTLVETSDERWWQAELLRIQGELLLTRLGNGQAPARSCFERAFEISRQQRARSLELRAATSLAQLAAEQGERQKAFDLLAPVYGWFTEGFNTADLKDAKALLDEWR